MRDDFFVSRSSRRPVCFSLRSAGVYQGEDVLKVTVLVLRGAIVLREVDKVELRWFVRSSGEMGVESRGRVVESRSERWWGSMDFRLRKVISRRKRGRGVGEGMVNRISL